VSFHIPIRSSESHGVNIPRLEKIIAAGAKLVVTCDTGVTSHPAVEYARERGVDVIVTDHHDLPPRLPQAHTIINPKLLPAGHALGTISGAGVAYKFAEALLAGESDRAGALLDLAVLGLVADLAHLTGDSRYLVQKGLERLRNTERLGLKIMMEMAELSPAHLNEEHIGFVLGPRLNALGRLGDANPAVELLTTRDPMRARLLATQLENYNAQRQLLCNQVSEAAEAQLRADPSLLTEPVIILAHPAWPGGVIGIVAGRLAERYHKPAIVFSAPRGEPARGSARSIEGLNITAAIAAQEDLLLSFGGHPMAAGLSLAQENLPEFHKRLIRTVARMPGAAENEPALPIDAEIALERVDLPLAEVLESLAPFGPGNEKPVLAVRGLRIEGAAEIGRNNEHRRLVVVNAAGTAREVLWWDGSGQDLPRGRFDLAFTLRASDWRGTRQSQMTLVDLHELEQQLVDVKRRHVEVIDFRQASGGPERVAGLPEGTLVWAEGPDSVGVDSADRNHLSPAAALAIWTTPPGPEVLEALLERVAPARVYLFAAQAAVEDADTFLERLAGLLKYTVRRRQGKASYSELAAATAQREITVRRGLAWLVESGIVKLVIERPDDFEVAFGTSVKDPAAAARTRAEVQSLLAETAAYRAHFRRAGAETLVVK
jgi:single-stranded-DNA-specific exonuclease